MNADDLRKEIARLKRHQSHETDSTILLAIKYRIKELQDRLEKMKK
jgi:hypothetical protein